MRPRLAVSCRVLGHGKGTERAGTTVNVKAGTWVRAVISPDKRAAGN